MVVRLSGNVLKMATCSLQRHDHRCSSEYIEHFDRCHIMFQEEFSGTSVFVTQRVRHDNSGGKIQVNIILVLNGATQYILIMSHIRITRH